MEKSPIISVKPLSQQVYESIKEAIIIGKIEPGTRLKEKEMCEELKVSATPLREAFQQLAKDGLVEVIPYKGVKVREVEIGDLEEIYICRSMFEKQAVELAIENIDDIFIEDLKEIVNNSMNAITSREYVQSNTEFHNRILQQAMNKRLSSLFSQIEEIIIHNRVYSSYSQERMDEINKEHIGIIECIEKQDINGAQEKINEHIKNGFTYISKSIKLN